MNEQTVENFQQLRVLYVGCRFQQGSRAKNRKLINGAKWLPNRENALAIYTHDLESVKRFASEYSNP